MIVYLPFALFFIQVISLFFVTRFALNTVFSVLRMFIRHDPTVFSLISLLYLPGTIVHELAHFIVAITCMLRVRSITIFPSFEKNAIKLGSVVYEKKDIFRGIAVGIAPFFVALAFFWFLAALQLFPSSNIVVTILLSYLIFTISSTMFSSKQDLVDIVFIIPLFIIIGGIIYIFNIPITEILLKGTVMRTMGGFVNTVNFYLFFSIVINAVLIIFGKCLLLVIRR